jgi:6-phosphogluconolactonase
MLTILEDGRALAGRAAERFAALVDGAVRSSGAARVSLTGGTTPKGTYELLASAPWSSTIPWDRVHLYWGDERHVPPDHKNSNYGMARDALVMRVAIPAAQVHRMRGELPPEEAARLYERELPHRFDLVLLGLGEDTHIASIFPGSPVVQEMKRRVAAPWVPQLKAYRITLTPPALLNTSHIVMIVAGAGKAAAIAAALEAPADPARHPAHLLRAAGDRVEWLIDRAAARALSSPHA